MFSDDDCGSRGFDSPWTSWLISVALGLVPEGGVNMPAMSGTATTSNAAAVRLMGIGRRARAASINANASANTKSAPRDDSYTAAVPSRARTARVNASRMRPKEKPSQITAAQPRSVTYSLAEVSTENGRTMPFTGGSESGWALMYA